VVIGTVWLKYPSALRETEQQPRARLERRRRRAASALLRYWGCSAECFVSDAVFTRLQAQFVLPAPGLPEQTC